MLVDKSIKVKISKRNIDHFSEYYVGIECGDVIDIDIIHLQKKSNKKVKVSCDVCFSENIITYQSYNKNVNSCEELPIYTCVKCSSVKNKVTNSQKYGVDHYSKTNQYKDRVKETNLDRYGVDHYSKTDEYKERKSKTNMEKFGFKNPFHDKEMIRNSFLEKYGVDHPSKVPEIYDRISKTYYDKTGYWSSLSDPGVREKIKKTMLDRYGSTSPYSSESIRGHSVHLSNDENYIGYVGDNISEFNCDKGCDHNFEISSYMYYNRKKSNVNLCTVCNPISDSTSIKEGELYEYINSIYNGEVVRSYRDGLEIDIYLPELKIGFEFNGLYWHSEKYKYKNYHIDKTSYFNDKGIRIIHIWEDDWVERGSIIKSQISSILSISDTKIGARKCEVVKLSTRRCSEFLKENHIQGNDRSSVYIGLLYNDELVAVMTFNKFEGRVKMDDGEWNLSRFCNKLNTNVIGGAGKLLKWFIREYNATRIISYADRCWSEGNLYEKLGFERVKSSGPDYKYIVNGSRVNKRSFQRDKLESISEKESEKSYMQSNKIERIWDCGKLKYNLCV